MRITIIILAVLFGTVSYSQNSKANRALIKEAIMEYNYEMDAGAPPPIKFYSSRQISSATLMLKVEDGVKDVGLLVLFKDNHYEFLKGLNMDFVYKLSQTSLGEKEAFFFNFIDTEDHLGRSDRK